MILYIISKILLTTSLTHLIRYKDSFLSKIEKSDADIADAKKGAKAATWVNRGKLFYEAASEPTKNLFL